MTGRKASRPLPPPCLVEEPAAIDFGTIRTLAEAIADELNRRRCQRSRWVDARAVARHLGVDVTYVYEHAAELGARRLGSGPRARLRFQLDHVDATLCLAGRQSGQPEDGSVEPIRRRTQGRRLGTNVPLRPIRGEGE